MTSSSQRDYDRQPRESLWREHWVSLALFAVLLIVILGTVLLMSDTEQTAKEAALEAFILTSASIIASALVTRLYASYTYSQSLRDHGVQIASGMMVLKDQINALTDWVAYKRAAIGSDAYSSPDSTLEHIEFTLRGFESMTNAALGGIGGVIGDALAQYESVMDQISRLRREAAREEAELQEELKAAASEEEVASLHRRMEDLERRTEEGISRLARSSRLPIADEPLRKTIATHCPSCGRENLVVIIDSPGQTRAVACRSCLAPYNAHVTASHRILVRSRVAAAPTEKRRLPATDAFLEAAAVHLRSKKAYVRRRELEVLIPALVAAHKSSRSRGTSLSPQGLEEKLQSEPAVVEAGLGTGSIHRLVLRAYFGRLFHFGQGPAGVKMPYVNDFEEEDVMTAHLASCFHSLAKAFVLEHSHYELLYSFLGGEKWNVDLDKVLVTSGVTERTELRGGTHAEVKFASERRGEDIESAAGGRGEPHGQGVGRPSAEA